MILAQIAHLASHSANSLAFFQEEAAVGFSPMQLWDHMGWPARTIAIILFIESIWSLAVMIDRYLYFSAARKQSREFAPKVAGALKDSKLEEAIKIADRNKKSHLAEVVTAGLQEFRASAGQATESSIESSGRALTMQRIPVRRFRRSSRRCCARKRTGIRPMVSSCTRPTSPGSSWPGHSPIRSRSRSTSASSTSPPATARRVAV